MELKDEIIRRLVSGSVPESSLSRVMSVLEGNEEKDCEEGGVLDVKAAMRFLKISRPYLYILRRNGELKSYRLGKRVLFKREDLLKVLKRSQD